MHIKFLELDVVESVIASDNINSIMPDVVTLPLPNFDNASSSNTHGGFSPNENVFEPLVKNAVDPHIMVEVAQPAEQLSKFMLEGQ